MHVAFDLFGYIIKKKKNRCMIFKKKLSVMDAEENSD